MNPPVMHSIELFTGAGGLALGTHLAGFHHRSLFEWNEDACATLRRNASAEALPGIGQWRIRQEDVRGFPFRQLGSGQMHLVAGGAPCQPFSLGGKHRAQDDSRNMIPEFVRAVRELQPRAFILENVKGLTRASFRSYFEYIRLQLTFPTVTLRSAETWTDHLLRLEKRERSRRGSRETRYNVVHALLNAADFGVPQARHRVFIVGFRADTGLTWQAPEPTHTQDALLWRQYITGEYWESHWLPKPPGEPACPRSKLMKLLENDAPPRTAPWRTVRDALRGLPAPLADRECLEFSNHKFIPGARAYPGHTGSRYDWPAKTLKAGVHGVPGGENMLALPDGKVRYFTMRECARLQTFPDTWHFEGAWSEVMRQLGNAVPVKLARVVAESVAAKLGAPAGAH